MMDFSIPAPTDEEIAAAEQEKYRLDIASPNQFTHWFPSVQRAGVPHPKTAILTLPADAYSLPLQEDPDALYASETYQRIATWLASQFEVMGSDTLFVKNSLFSAKHSWNRTCKLTRDADPIMHVAAIMYQWCMAGHIFPDCLVAREMLPVRTLFTAFDGMPITQEYRLFTRNGQVEAYQAYWPEDAIEEHGPSVQDWRERLREVENAPSALLNAMVEYAEEVVSSLKGDWSVDFLIAKDNAPYLIDMALARESYRRDDAVVLTGAT